MALPPILLGVLLYTAETLSMNTLDRVTVREGGTVTIPCLYDNQYKLNSKLWCRGFYWLSCQITARANDTGKWTITDYPAHNIVNVKLDYATSSDSGIYWCAVEIHAKPDDRKHLYLTVQQAPDVSVMNSSVSGHEGDNVSVQCFYTSGYQYKLKQWCRIRYKDKSCYTVGRTDTSQNSSVQISDDGRSSFTVLMTGLRLSDSGWYFCSAGNQQAPVQLLVQRDNEKYKNTSESDISSDEDGPSSNSEIARNDTADAWSDHRNRIFLLLSAAFPLLTLVLVIWRIIQKHNLPTQGRDICSEIEGLVMYDAVVFKKGKDDEQNQVSISRPPDQEVIYSAVKLH